MSTPDTESDIENVISMLKYNDNGLIPAIAQQHDTGEVLMMAWMNNEAVKETLSSGTVCYYSRSRQKLWRKGESSGQTQILKKFRFDCDQDTILLLVDQKGVACHTGRRNCFFREVDTDGIVNIIAEVEISPETLYKK